MTIQEREKVVNDSIRNIIFYVFILTRVLTVIKNLEKSWKFKKLIPGPGKVLENNIFPKVLEKSWQFKVDLSCYI